MSLTPLRLTSLLNYPKFQSCSSSSPPPRRLVSHGRSPANDYKLVLYDALDSSGIDTTHARDARKGFLTEIENLSQIERAASISINRCVDLGRTALYIAAEDDSLVSRSSVPLPVDAFIKVLDDLSLGYCSHYSLSFRDSPESFINSLETYLYVKKGFRRTNAKDQLDIQALYLPSVLMHLSGSAALLSLIYSEVLKMLRLWDLFDFDYEIFFPHELHALPRGYDKQKSTESDQKHIMITQTLLEEILRDLKEAFWPFPFDSSKSLFLRGAHAASYIDKSSNDGEESFQLASIKTAQYRFATNVRFGDMRRALAACERLILLESDPKEFRDYSILLYHCGFYEESWKFLKLYEDIKSSSLEKQSSNKYSNPEEDAAEKLMSRLNFILMEKSWSKPSNS
ncbi:uncharacterized protein LOC8270878 isoform X2 [Ricinus communis]|uniref:uncharacterized protein LOC8270878 isoform X2 n=1 Tax=Ricinus communis TaxID=3988 RepID=UPI00201AA0BE|nr:uncharacterized protein LOC8270878 isoform X2 [Ricinus communis]